MILIFRYFFAYSWLIFCCFIGILICLVRPFHPNNVYHISKLISLLSPHILGIKLLIRNRNILKDSGPCVIISNHQDSKDLFFGPIMIEPHVVTLGKIELLRIPIFGVMYMLAGNILINRSNKRKALESMKKVKDKIQKNSMKVWVMPEGTRSRKRGLLPFKKGAFYTALDAEVPIIPIVFSEYHKSLNLNKLKSGTEIIEVMDPIDTSSYKKEDITKLIDHAHTLMKNKLDELNQESLKKN